MILYLEDWKKYPTAIPHYTTSNKSWVRLAGLFHKMGIENSLFHLALHNPALEHVNPHDKDLSTEQIAMIVDEVSENPWYALREIVKVPPVAGVDPVDLRANRANISMYWLFFNHVTTMLIQPRQTGKSVSTDCLMCVLFTMLVVNTDMSLLTKDDSLRVRNVARLKDIIATLPEYFNLRDRADANNTERLTLRRLGNTYSTSVAQSSKKAALNLGRGMTNAINDIDEIAFINNIEITLPAFLASSGAARDEAERIGAPYGNIFTTTPGYLSTKSGRYAYQIYNEACRWSENYFDSKNRDDLLNVIVNNSSGGKELALLDYNHRQLGYTDNWLRRKIADARAEGDSAEADFLGIWPEGTGSSPIDKEVMAIVIKSRRYDNYNYISKQDYVIKWFLPGEDIDTKLTDRILIAGLDTSEAIGKDGIGLVIRDGGTGETLGVGDYNQTNTVQFAEWLVELLVEFPTMTLIIERKNTGVSIIDAMIRLMVHKRMDPFARLFNMVVNDCRINPKFATEVVNVPFGQRDSSVYEKYRKYFGYTTTGAGRTSRGVLYGEIFNASLRYTANSVRDPKLISQLSGLVVKNGRIDHTTDSHDDLIIGWLLGYWLLTKAENISFYGIDRHKVLTTVTKAVEAENGGPEGVAAKKFQTELKEEIDILLDKLKTERSPVKSNMIVSRLKLLYRDLDVTVIQPFNIDTLINNIELEKKRRRFRY